MEDQRKLGIEFSEDNYRIVAKHGETAFAMIQNYENLGRSVFHVDPNTLTPDQKLQLSQFADCMEEVHQATGYYPDESMSRRNSGNLRFTQDKRLVLVDTNHILRDSLGNLTMKPLTDKLRTIASTNVP
ncbi:hypothetical protein HY407_00980 [Candidatus Gottesmanbacteria bacterium]|nr:hypothetical protein [Candidatus Gottesmanbacteria bacterium]